MISSLSLEVQKLRSVHKVGRSLIDQINLLSKSTLDSFGKCFQNRQIDQLPIPTETEIEAVTMAHLNIFGIQELTFSHTRNLKLIDKNKVKTNSELSNIASIDRN